MSKAVGRPNGDLGCPPTFVHCDAQRELDVPDCVVFLLGSNTFDFVPKLDQGFVVHSGQNRICGGLLCNPFCVTDDRRT